MTEQPAPQFVLWHLAVRGTAADRDKLFQELLDLAEYHRCEINALPEEAEPDGDAANVQEAQEH